jgi:hypothetical protein
MGGSDAVT